MDSGTLNTLKHTLRQMAEFTDEQIKLCAGQLEKRVYKKDSFFSTPQSPCGLLGFLAKGLLRRYVIDKDGNEATYNFIADTRQRLFSSYAAVFLNIIQPSYIQALEDSVICVLTRERLMEYW